VRPVLKARPVLKYLSPLPLSSSPKAMSEDNADLFCRCHSSIWSVDHLRPSAALNELCKLLYAKICDERRWGGTRFHTVEGSPLRTGKQVRLLYADSVTEGRQLVGSVVPKGILEEPLQLSDAAIFGVVDLLQGFSFSESGVDVKGAAFQQLTEAAVRSGMGQYFTPEPVVRFMVQLSRVSHKDRVLDPFCGSGHFLAACADSVSQIPGISSSELAEFEAGGLYGIEKDEHMVRVALTDLLIQGRSRIHLLNTDSLLPFPEYDNLLDMRLGSSGNGFSLVLTNPPFGKRLPKEAMTGLGDFELGSSERPTPLEVLGLERATTFLKPGGRMAIVLPHSVLTNRSMQAVREYIARTCKIRAIVSLPPETFSRHAGVGQASILFLERRFPTDHALAEGYAVYCSSCHSVGYDQTGRAHGRDELPEIAAEYATWSNRDEGPLRLGFAIDVSELLKKGFGPEQHRRDVNRHSAKYGVMSDLCAGVFTGAAPGRASFTNSGSRIIKVGDLTGEGIDWVRSGERGWVDTAFARKHSEKRLRVGDILLTAAAHQRRYIGLKVDIVDTIPSEMNLVLCSPEVLVIRPHADRINPYYLLSWLRSREGHSAIQSCIRGQTAHLYPGDVKELEVPLPPRGSQRAIDALEKKVREALRLREISKSMARGSSEDFAALVDSVEPCARTRAPTSGPVALTTKHQTDLQRWHRPTEGD
jgi:type I restriction enzyme M protein